MTGPEFGGADIPLQPSPWRRWGRRVFGICMVLVGLVPVYFAVGFLYGAITKQQYPLALVALIPAIGAVALIVPGVRAIRLGFADSPRIRLTEFALEIFHPDHMTEPASIPRSTIKDVEIDTTPWKTPIIGYTRRFPIGGSMGGWMFSYTEGSHLPVIGSTYQIPNLLIAFHEPFVFSTARLHKDGVSEEVGRPEIPGLHLAPSWNVLRISRKEPFLGFMATAVDPRRAAARIQPWLLDSPPAHNPLLERDWTETVIENAHAQRTRRFRFWVAVLAAAFVIGQIMDRLVN